MADPTPQQLAKALTLDERMSELARGFGTTGLLTAPAPDKIENEKYYQGMPNAIGYLSDMVKNAIYGAAKAAVLPGHVAQGGQWNENDVTDMALNIAGMGGFGSMGLGKAAVGGRGGKVLGANVYQGGPNLYGPEGAAESLKHIGKGEGNATYGWGRYDAGNPKVATGYQDSVGPKILDLEQPARELGLELSRDARIELGRQASAGKPLPDAARHSQYANIELRDVPSDKLEKLIDLKRQSQQTYLYKHDLPDEDIARYLDWDKPLSEQPENVRAGVARVVGNAIEDGANGPMQMVGNVTNSNGMTNRADPTSFSRLDGSSIHEMLQKVYGRQGVSEALGKAGIPGLRYLDQGSRQYKLEAPSVPTHDWMVVNDRGGIVAKGKKEYAEKWIADKRTSNYVTWDQDVLNRMKLLERDGETFGMTGNPAMLVAGQNQDRPGPSKMALELAKRLSDQEFYAKGGI